jgi:cell division protein FtsW (lipid II flippase)
MSSRRWLAVEIAAVAVAIVIAWLIGWLATEAWIERAAQFTAGPSPDDVRSDARVASLYFTGGAALLSIARIACARRANDPITAPLLLPAALFTCLLGLAVHAATLDTRAGIALAPTAAPFAQGVFFGAIAASAVIAAPFDLVRALARGWYVIAGVIAAVFVALALAGSGPGASGARINLGPVQPIEVVKLLFVVLLAVYFGSRAAKLRWQRDRLFFLRWPRPILLVPAIAALATIFAGLYVVGDLGPVLILAFVFLGMFYAVTRSTGWAVMSLAFVAALGAIAAAAPAIVSVGRVTTRIAMWRDPWWNGVAHGDQLGESLWALSAGGAFGQGLGDAHTPLVPAGKTDLVIATLVEQLGAAGLMVYLGLIGAIALSALYVAVHARTPERVLLAAGAALLVVVQWAIIFGGTFGLLPLSGVVAPFLSSGRSSMIVFVALVGLVLRVASDGRPRAELEELAELRGGARGLAIAVVLLLTIGAGAGVHRSIFAAEETSANGIATRLRDGTIVTRMNPRLLALAARVRRGSIEDRDGAPIAISDAAGARSYPLGGAFGTLVGSHPSEVLLPPWSLERTFDHRLRGFGDRTDGSAGAWPDLRSFAPWLALSDGERRAHVRALDARIASRSVRLSIDGELQRAVATLLAARGSRSVGAAAAVVIDVDTGHILARAQVPDLDPNGSWEAEVGDPAFEGAYGAWPDKTGVRGIFQSGSVGKLFTALAAARTGWSVTGDACGADVARAFSCVDRDVDGPFFTRPGWTRPIHDHARDRNHGSVALSEAIAVSCNVYFAQLALALGPAPFVELQRAGVDVGFGGPFAPGAPDSRQLASTGFGQGALAMSVVQAARLVAAIGSGGVYRRCAPTMELGAACSEVALLDDPRALAPILAGMRAVMTSGTGRALDAPAGVRVYGKTGTADVRGFAGEEPFGIERSRQAPPHSWFVALAEPDTGPACGIDTRGRIAIAVVVPRGGSGASAAGPLAMQIVAAARELGYLGGP